MRTICFSKPVSELALQTGLTRPRSWTEEVSDLGRGSSPSLPSTNRDLCQQGTVEVATIKNCNNCQNQQLLYYLKRYYITWKLWELEFNENLSTISNTNKVRRPN